jgi:hypothetical protein
VKTVEQRLEEMGLTLSDEDRQVIIRVAKALGLPDNDAMLSIVGALQMYQKLYSAIPQNINRTAAATLEKFKAAVDAEALAAHSRAEAALSEGVAKAAQDIANHTARKQQWQWVSVGLVLATVAVVVASWFSFAKGVQTGRRTVQVQLPDGKPRKQTRLTTVTDTACRPRWTSTILGR